MDGARYISSQTIHLRRVINVSNKSDPSCQRAPPLRSPLLSFSLHVILLLAAFEYLDFEIQSSKCTQNDPHCLPAAKCIIKLTTSDRITRIIGPKNPYWGYNIMCLTLGSLLHSATTYLIICLLGGRVHMTRRVYLGVPLNHARTLSEMKLEMKHPQNIQ